MRKYCNVLMTICILHGVRVLGQNSNDLCKQEVYQCYKKLNYIKNPGKQICFMDYLIHTEVRDTINKSNSSSELKILINDDQMRMMSHRMKVYQDRYNYFVIVPGQHLIYRMDPPKKMGDNKMNSPSTLRDTLFDMSHVVSCKDLSSSDGKEVKRVVLALSPQGKKYLQVDSVYFEIIPAISKLRKVRIHYVSGIYRAVTFTFKAQNLNYHTTELNTPVISLVYPGGHLAAKYKGFHVEDMRIKGKNRHSH